MQKLKYRVIPQRDEISYGRNMRYWYGIQRIEESELKLKPTVIAMDGLAIIVNKENSYNLQVTN